MLELRRSRVTLAETDRPGGPVSRGHRLVGARIISGIPGIWDVLGKGRNRFPGNRLAARMSILALKNGVEALVARHEVEKTFVSFFFQLGREDSGQNIIRSDSQPVRLANGENDPDQKLPFVVCNGRFLFLYSSMTSSKNEWVFSFAGLQILETFF